MQTDLHQHLWTAPLLDALAARRIHPFVRRGHDGSVILHTASEPACVIDVPAQSAPARRRELARDGAQLAVVAISSPIGIEALDPQSADELIDAHLEGVLDLGPEFAAWGPIAVREPDPGQVRARLERGCLGISVPAGALASRAALTAMLPLLAAAQEAEAPVLVHPGPGPQSAAHPPGLDEPLWSPALTDYVSEMQAAWLSFATEGRRELPRLRVVFAMLAGGAALLAERLLARGGPVIDLRDPATYYDTSSFGPRMVETMARWVGPDQLVYGSDRPVVEPQTTGREAELMAAAGALVAPNRALAAAVAA